MLISQVLTVQLFNGGILGELFKINSLVTHYVFHQSKSDDTNLFGFIKTHYFSGILIDEDYEKDMELPFKDMTYSNFYISVVVPRHVEFEVSSLLFDSESPLSAFNQDGTIHSFNGEIWLPPKINS